MERTWNKSNELEMGLKICFLPCWARVIKKDEIGKSWFQLGGLIILNSKFCFRLKRWKHMEIRNEWSLTLVMFPIPFPFSSSNQGIENKLSIPLPIFGIGLNWFLYSHFFFVFLISIQALHAASLGMLWKSHLGPVRITYGTHHMWSKVLHRTKCYITKSVCGTNFTILHHHITPRICWEEWRILHYRVSNVYAALCRTIVFWCYPTSD